MSELTAIRRAQISEALGDVETTFFDPGAFGDCPLRDVTTSLASEFDAGPLRDEEIVGRLEKLVAAESLGDPKAARRHLTFVRRKLLQRFGVTPVESVPVVPDAVAQQLGRDAGKVQVAPRQIDETADETAGVGDCAIPAQSGALR